MDYCTHASHVWIFAANAVAYAMHTNHFDEINEKFRHDCTYSGAMIFYAISCFAQNREIYIHSFLAIAHDLGQKWNDFVSDGAPSVRGMTDRTGWTECVRGGDKWSTQKRTIKTQKKRKKTFDWSLCANITSKRNANTGHNNTIISHNLHFATDEKKDQNIIIINKHFSSSLSLLFHWLRLRRASPSPWPSPTPSPRQHHEWII